MCFFFKTVIRPAFTSDLAARTLPPPIMPPPDPLHCSLFACLAFTLAGIGQTLWLKSRGSIRFARPIDGGRTFRGRRILGDNKTWRGFVLMVPAVGVGFVVSNAILGMVGIADLWPLSTGEYFLLGAWVGLGFMAAELPNSFLKRQCGIGPGAAASGYWTKRICFLIDQVDSIVGGLVALNLVVPVPGWSWVQILVAGPVVHWLFNAVFYMVGLKTRAA